MTHELPALPYDYEALEPHIDAETMRLHHGKHHATYVANLNKALEKYPELQERSVEDLVCNLDQLPEDIRAAVRNNGGGHANHSMFWETMSPDGGGKPLGPFATALKRAFGSFEDFKQQFVDAGLKRFGSGWVWLVISPAGELQITTTANQDNPMTDGYAVIMGNDVWEHAYYLKYQNKRADYLNAWWNVVDWMTVGARYDVCDYVAEMGEHIHPMDEEEIATPS